VASVRLSAAASDVERLRRRAYRADAQQDAIQEAAEPEEEETDECSMSSRWSSS
jgi:hypothetical protein